MSVEVDLAAATLPEITAKEEASGLYLIFRVADGERRVGVVVDKVIDVATDPDARAGEPVAAIGPERFLEN